ncbi:MAG: chemotaxis protein CheW [bacterium]
MGSNSQYLQMFLDESNEYVQLLNENVLALEENPNNEEMINAIFRAAHSLKGMSATMGFDMLTNLTHKIENILDKVRNKELQIDVDIIQFLFNGLDYITALINDIKSYGEEKTDVRDYINELKNYLESKKNVTSSFKDDTIYTASSSIELNNNELEIMKEKIHKEHKTVYHLTVKLESECMIKGARGLMVLKKAEKYGEIIKTVPAPNEIEDEKFDNEINIIFSGQINIKDIESKVAKIPEVASVTLTIFELKKEVENKKQNFKQENKKIKNKNSLTTSISPTVRVDIGKLDNLMNMVGELLINKTRLEGLKIKRDAYTDIIQQLDRVTMELHHIVMQIRMVPIGGIFNRFPRMIRDIAKELNKEIDLIIEGADTELDRSIIDELADPLVHILRNASDHGIESPEEREKAGKNKSGTILLKAYQKGSEILIEVEDDGRGIDADSLSQKALEKGIITAEEVSAMTKEEKLNLVFHPGFSTAQKVTDISGRGVGMDVVKRTVEGLDGQIFIESEKKQGSKFIISLPLTLAITQALMVVIGEEIFAIPLSAIKETLLINPDDIKKMRGKEVIRLRDTTIPIVKASKKLNINNAKDYEKEEELSVVIVNSSNKQIGLVVDELLHQQEIVIKSLGNYLINIDNISGATIIGDGNVALILDVRNIA